jgi:uncharacterized membrane protein
MRNRWLVGGLIGSVIVNLLLIGFIVGRIGMMPLPGMSPDPTVGYGRMLRFLPDDRRAVVMPIVRERMHDVLSNLHTLKTEQQAVLDALQADPYDKDKLAAALAALRGTLTSMQESAHRSLVDVAATLTPDERRHLAEAMRRPPFHHRSTMQPAPAQQRDTAPPPPHD